MDLSKKALAIVGVLIVVAGVCGYIIGDMMGFQRRQGLPNPAAVFCEECGGIYEVRTASDGSQYGVCIINGTEYDAWEFWYEHHEYVEP